uniref:Uncharacterized protein n=1 Tax=Arundo donax TaxID=35708 RepID=A0A0A9AMK7_ARUDO
MSNTTLSNIK